MRSLFEEGGLDLFGKWLTTATDPEVRAYVALCISNLARKGTPLSLLKISLFRTTHK